MRALPERPHAGRGWIAAVLLGAATSFPANVRAQVMHVEAGASTAERAGGSRIRFWHGRSQGWIAAGDAGTHGPFGVGGYVRRRMDGWTLELGDIELPLVVDTDVFGAGSGIPLRGIGYDRATAQRSWALYAGATTREMSGPSFRSATTDRPVLAARFDAVLRHDLTVSARTAVSHRTTSIQSLRWHVDPGLQLGVAAGLGGGQPYAAASVIRERDEVSVRAVWIRAGDRFRRQVARLPDVAEADGLNARIVFRPTAAIDITAGRHSYLIAEQGVAAPALRYATHTLGAQMRRGVFTTSITGHEAAVRDGRTRGLHARVGVTPYGRVKGDIAVLASDPAAGGATSAVAVSISERLTQRLALTQVVTRASGHTSISFGGELITNPVRARIEYHTLFVPVTTGSAFRQAMVVQTEILPAGDLRIQLGTHVRPDGRVTYRVSAGTWLNTSGPARSSAPIRIPRYMIRGRVLDQEGRAIAGAALRVGDELVFTNSAGEFFVRLKDDAPREVRIETGEFLTVPEYEAVTAGASVRPADTSRAEPLTLVARRVDRRRN